MPCVTKLGAGNQFELCGELGRINVTKNFKYTTMPERGHRQPARSSGPPADQDAAANQRADFIADISRRRDPELLEKRRDVACREPTVSSLLARQLCESEDALVRLRKKLNLEREAVVYEPLPASWVTSSPARS